MYFGVSSGLVNQPSLAKNIEPGSNPNVSASQRENPLMLLDDESSIADSIHELEPKKVLFSNPFFSKPAHSSVSPDTKRSTLFKGIPASGGTISARGDLNGRNRLK
jgi:hypothetical protein